MRQILFAFSLFLSVSLSAQDYDTLAIPDSLKDLEQIEFYQIPLCSCIQIYNVNIIQDDSTYQSIFYSDYVQKYCSEFTPSEIDFTKKSLLCISNFGDCNAKFNYKIFKDDIQKEIIILIYEYYGGSRGMCSFDNAFFIKKIQSEYKLKIQEINIDEKY
ncbi:MAG: hypothetical protein JW866_05615 [Ignavibacteriales bacterium]|nr:hypothetical protein [Ignavibacteriales bacterium]